jgi:hypothetical protein
VGIRVSGRKEEEKEHGRNNSYLSARKGPANKCNLKYTRQTTHYYSWLEYNAGKISGDKK